MPHNSGSPGRCAAVRGSAAGQDPLPPPRPCPPPYPPGASGVADLLPESAGAGPSASHRKSADRKNRAPGSNGPGRRSAAGATGPRNSRGRNCGRRIRTVGPADGVLHRVHSPRPGIAVSGAAALPAFDGDENHCERIPDIRPETGPDGQLRTAPNTAVDMLAQGRTAAADRTPRRAARADALRHIGKGYSEAPVLEAMDQGDMFDTHKGPPGTRRTPSRTAIQSHASLTAT